MSDTNRPQQATSEDMLSRLPYALTKGVVATEEGLVFTDRVLAPFIGAPYLLENNTWLMVWHDVAVRLRYREGRPWCSTMDSAIICESGSVPVAAWQKALYRLAAILVDDAEAFRVLHWCLTNLGGSDE